MFIFKSAVAFILIEKALNSDTEKEKWKGLDSPVPVNMERFPWYEKKMSVLTFYSAKAKCLGSSELEHILHINTVEPALWIDQRVSGRRAVIALPC